ncbi:hypothetical protein M0R45_035394 [Rubus argutus]|uniref:Uncharacterized protein n=1 Tax=Rubus argutus TaxID=59490 RepID=A0AAW1VWP8_RUBAR
MSAVGSSEVDKEEVLELEQKLSQCRRKREQLLREKEMKHGRLMRGLDYVEKKIETARQGGMNAISEFEKEQKALQQLLENKNKSVRQLNQDIDKFLYHEPYKSTQFKDVKDKFDKLTDTANSQLEQLKLEKEKLRLLDSCMDEKLNKLFDFIKFHLKSSKMTVEVKALLRSEFTVYVGTLNLNDDNDKKSYAMLTNFMDCYLNPDVKLSEEEKKDDKSIANKLWKFLIT